MIANRPRFAPGTRSYAVRACQSCDNPDLKPGLFVGFLPPVNQMFRIGEVPVEQPSYPAQLLYCEKCSLVQLGLVVDPDILFPPEYPYTSGTTRILHENFADLARESAAMLGLGKDDLVVDIGSNDGTLLSKFAGAHRVLGIEPTDAYKLAHAAGIPTINAFFTREAADRAVAQKGRASVVTVANCFAHMDGIHEVIDGILAMLAPDGVFVSESHYLVSLLETLQYDTIYHEHLRYYSLESLGNLLAVHGLEIIHARRIPSHGGSFRAYAARAGTRAVNPSVAAMLAQERARGPLGRQLADFSKSVVASKLALYGILADLRAAGRSIAGVSAPSRASTLVRYVGLDDGLLDAVAEIAGSKKIGFYLPGTRVPIVDESEVMGDPPDVLLLLSWHIAGELMPKLRARGFVGQFLVPLPVPRLIDHPGFE